MRQLPVHVLRLGGHLGPGQQDQPGKRHRNDDKREADGSQHGPLHSLAGTTSLHGEDYVVGADDRL